MARINFEDQLFNDPRYKTLEMIHGPLLAGGIALHAFKLAQHYWCKEGEEMRGVPLSLFISAPQMQSFIDVGLAEIKDEAVYVKGTLEKFDWVFQARENGKKGGRPIKNKVKKEPVDNPKITTGLPDPIPNDTGTKPETTPLYSSLSSPNLYINKGEIIVSASDVLKMFNEKLGGKGKIEHAPYILASNMVDDFKNLSGSPAFQDPGAWEKYFSKILESEYLTILRPVDFGWILKSENAAAIISGRYKNRVVEEKAGKSKFEASVDVINEADKLYQRVVDASVIAVASQWRAKFTDHEREIIEKAGGSKVISSVTKPYDISEIKKVLRQEIGKAS